MWNLGRQNYREQIAGCQGWGGGRMGNGGQRVQIVTYPQTKQELIRVDI